MIVFSGPAGSDGRIGVIDALRGFALIGILFVNIIGMGGPIDATQPQSPPGLANPDWQIWLTSHLFLEGAMRGLFSLLFGASALLFLRSGARAGAFLRRCGWLLVFGLVNATLLLWPGDILMVYAMAGPIVLLLSKARPATQLVAAGLIIVLISAWSYLAATSVPGDIDADAGAAAGALAQEQAARLGGYSANLAFMSRTSLEWTFSPMTLWWVLDAAAFMLVGMALFRLNLLDGHAPLRRYWALAAGGFSLGLPLRAWEAAAAFDNAGGYPPIAEATFQCGRLLVTLGWLGAFMLTWRAIGNAGAFVPLSALGRTALSGYLTQSILAAFIFSGFGLSLWNQLSWPMMWTVAAIIMLGLSVLAMVWLRFFRMGPMEWVWRTLIFWRLPP